MRTIKTYARRMVGGVRKALADMDYAQRRLIELNFELPLEADRRREQIEALEALYRLEAQAPQGSQREQLEAR